MFVVNKNFLAATVSGLLFVFSGSLPAQHRHYGNQLMSPEERNEHQQTMRKPTPSRAGSIPRSAS